MRRRPTPSRSASSRALAWRCDLPLQRTCGRRLYRVCAARPCHPLLHAVLGRLGGRPVDLPQDVGPQEARLIRQLARADIGRVVLAAERAVTQDRCSLRERASHRSRFERRIRARADPPSLRREVGGVSCLRRATERIVRRSPRDVAAAPTDRILELAFACRSAASGALDLHHAELVDDNGRRTGVKLHCAAVLARRISRVRRGAAASRQGCREDDAREPARLCRAHSAAARAAERGNPIAVRCASHDFSATYAQPSRARAR